ncbi:MAG TPA: DUF6666 family protein, partial [Pirellulales bacterium]
AGPSRQMPAQRFSQQGADNGATQAGYQDGGMYRYGYGADYQNAPGNQNYLASATTGGGWQPFGGLFSKSSSTPGQPKPSKAQQNGGDAPAFGSAADNSTPKPVAANQPHDPIVRPEAVYLDTQPVASGATRAGSRPISGLPPMRTAMQGRGTTMGATPSGSMPSRGMPSGSVAPGSEMELPAPRGGPGAMMQPGSMMNQRSMMHEGQQPMMQQGEIVDGQMMDGPMIEDGGDGMTMDQGGDGFTNPYCNDCSCGHCGSGGCGWGGDSCNSCGGCCGDCDDECCGHHSTEHEPYGRPWLLAPFDWLDDKLSDPCTGWWWGEDFTVFAGVQNFRGPVDLGVNSNFGFDEGINTSIPICFAWDIAWQFGFEATQSDLESTTILDQRRNQFFITTGLFHRAPCCGGWDVGAVFDWLHDEFYQDYDVGQVRGNLGYWWDCKNEIGCDVAVGVVDDRSPQGFSVLGATRYDVVHQYFLYWGRRLSCGGTGKIGGGFTSNDSGLVGANFNVPISKCFAIEGGFNYLISGNQTNEIPDETWNVGINLVWYPGSTARCGCLPFRPLLNVADNGSLFVTRHGTQRTPPQ